MHDVLDWEKWRLPHWGKPFGSGSYDREHAISEGGRPRKRGGFKKYGTPADRKKYLAIRNRRISFGEADRKPFLVEPTVKVRAYAHDRIVWTVFDRLPPAVTVRAAAGPSVGELVAGCAALGVLRETRRGFRVGNRWRFRPSYNSFTVHARNTVMDAGHIIEHHAKGQAIFQTLTMAGGTRKAYACMAAASGYIVDRIGRWLRGRVVNGFFAYVYELQKRGAPHLHYLFRLPDDVDVDDFALAFKDQWRKILDNVSDESGVDLYARAGGGTWRGNPDYPNCQSKLITDGYAQYMAKYASKERSKGGISSPFRPGRWWGVSYAVRKEIKKRRLDVYFPVRRLLDGIQLAQSVIEAGGKVCKSYKWVDLPPWVVLQSVSIFCDAGVALDVVRAIIVFVETGDMGAFARVLKVLAKVYDST